MPINDKQRDDLVPQKTLDMVKNNFNKTAEPNTTTLKSKNSLNKDNPDHQSKMQQEQQKNGKSNLSMMIPNMLMQAFMQQLSKNPELQKMLQTILGQTPTSPTPLSTRPKP